MSTEKTIFDIMTDDMRKLEEFKAACDNMLKTQYVLVETKITAILQTIASSKLLYSLFDDLLRDFDYKKAAKNCIQLGHTLKMPAEPKNIAALVFCIMLDIDKKAIDLKDFLKFFMRNDDIMLAYETFLQELILPFKNSVLYLITMIITEANAGAIKSNHKIQIPKTEKLLPEVSLESIMSIFKSRISTDTTISDIVKDYLSILCDDLTEAVRQKNLKRSRNIQDILCRRLQTSKPLLARELEKINLEDFIIVLKRQ